MNTVHEITQRLRAVQRGDTGASDELMKLVYDELRDVAAARMRREVPGHTLQPTALVHEAWLRLGADEQPAWNNRAHFFGAAAEAMRRVLIDRARRRRALRRGGGQPQADVDILELTAPPDNDDRLLAVDEALARFAASDPQKAEFVKLRYFAGLTIDEAAQMLGISRTTAKRWWNYSRACLHAELEPER
ncbi:MAG TPA: ECF-type sigma factor [Opitutaceae bacterium]